MPRKKSRVTGLNISDDTAKNAILAHLGDSILDNAGEIISLAGIYALSHDYWGNPPDALKQTAITYMLMRHGSEVGVAAALGGIVLREFMKKSPESSSSEPFDWWPEGWGGGGGGVR